MRNLFYSGLWFAVATIVFAPTQSLFAQEEDNVVLDGMDGVKNPVLIENLSADPSRVGGNMHGYEFATINDTPTPKGYEPFYLSHYGRHGSRSSWSMPQYKYLKQVLVDAMAAHNLSAAGRQLLEETKAVIAADAGMAGRLTDRGEREHRQLAERMYMRFPNIFRSGNKQVRAISSTVTRCLLSMASFTNQLVRMDKDLQFNFDAGSVFQEYIDCAGQIDNKPQWEVIDSLTRLLPDDKEEVYIRLFDRPEEAKKLYPADSLQDAIYQTAIVAQDFDQTCNIFRYMSPLAIYRREVNLSLSIFGRFGNVPGVIEQRRQFVQRGLNDFISKADEAIHEGTYCADLRFGHDFPLLAIVSTMELSGVGSKLDFGDIEKNWECYRNLCMASNLQMIFYHPKKDKPSACADEDILVKIIYNDLERTVDGLTPVDGVYYRWSDLKKKWGQKKGESLAPWSPSI